MLKGMSISFRVKAWKKIVEFISMLLDQTDSDKEPFLSMISPGLMVDYK